MDEIMDEMLTIEPNKGLSGRFAIKGVCNSELAIAYGKLMFLNDLNFLRDKNYEGSLEYMFTYTNLLPVESEVHLERLALTAKESGFDIISIKRELTSDIISVSIEIYLTQLRGNADKRIYDEIYTRRGPNIRPSEILAPYKSMYGFMMSDALKAVAEYDKDNLDSEQAVRALEKSMQKMTEVVITFPQQEGIKKTISKFCLDPDWIIEQALEYNFQMLLNGGHETIATENIKSEIKQSFGRYIIMTKHGL